MGRKLARGRREPQGASERPGQAVDLALHEVFSPEAIDEMRAQTGYNPRQRKATAERILLTVVEAFLVGKTLCFAPLRAIYLKHFGTINASAFQRRFKTPAAVRFFAAAVERLVCAMVAAVGLELEGPLAGFTDVRLYDGTGQRVPARGKNKLPACAEDKAATKWVFGYSLKSGLLEQGLGGSGRAAEIPLWRRLVPQLASGVLYLLDLGFFERRLFVEAQRVGAHVLMRRKSSIKLRVLGHLCNGQWVELPDWSVGYYVSMGSRRRGVLYDLDVAWGSGSKRLVLRMVGYAHSHKQIRWYLTTVPRDLLDARQVVQAYRLRWLIEFLFRELKQEADFGRSSTADEHAVRALTWGAVLGHAFARSLRIRTSDVHDIPLQQLRPLACLHVLRAYASQLFHALAARDMTAWNATLDAACSNIVILAREKKPSRSRMRIALELGAVGA